jgi:hypothetical protein
MISLLNIITAGKFLSKRSEDPFVGAAGRFIRRRCAILFEAVEMS